MPNLKIWDETTQQWLYVSKGAAGDTGVVGPILSMTEKTSVVDNDLFIIEDSADSYAKKKLKKSSIGIDGSKITGYLENVTGIGISVKGSTTLDLPNNEETTVTFATSSWESKSSEMTTHWTVGDPSKIYCRKTGIYIINTWYILSQSGTTGQTYVRFRKNTNTIMTELDYDNVGYNITGMDTFVTYLTANDYIELTVSNYTGVTNTISNNRILSLAKIA
jgi:hypothetical protein